MGIKCPGWVKKYRFVLLVALVGLLLLCLPTGPEASEPVPEIQAAESMEERLEKILSRIQGAGEVAE